MKEWSVWGGVGGGSDFHKNPPTMMKNKTLTPPPPTHTHTTTHLSTQFDNHIIIKNNCRRVLTLYLIETHFNAFANRADPDRIYNSCIIRVCSVCLWKYDIADPTLVELASNFFVLCTNMKFIYIIIHCGWSLA